MSECCCAAFCPPYALSFLDVFAVFNYDLSYAQLWFLTHYASALY